MTKEAEVKRSAWQEQWEISEEEGDEVLCNDGHPIARLPTFPVFTGVTRRERAVLLAAAPLLARALCIIEWSSASASADARCHACAKVEKEGHTERCVVDQALEAAGLSSKVRRQLRFWMEAESTQTGSSGGASVRTRPR